ncbi:MAG: flagellar type III secretion system protein FliR [Nisaea sp.]|uniref:flagellar biosynthetic protein FliR n=1 Tax=Nisaea sp. TaxID=2024842 RepID=UPI001B27D12B|nr:flagellar biosynthetic protein FliR [Nisaea sp.]MBO6559960.1 flagellar type III secretion system protein FliR [Nisaea sp.]
MPLEDFLPTQVYIVLLVLARVGGTVMLIPGIGETFVPVQFRMILAIGLSLVVAPLVGNTIPFAPTAPELVRLLFIELVIGLYFGIVARIVLLSLDTAGQVIAMNTGLANAQIFNPALATQGSLPGFFLLNLATLLLLIADLHHLLIRAMIDSYTLFPPGAALPVADFADAISRIIANSFEIAIQISAPFLVLGLLFYVVMGIMARLMPQLQIFFVALPVQVMMGLVILSLVLGGAMMVFLEYYSESIGRYVVPI